MRTLLAWGFTVGFGWLWWHYYKTGVVHSRGGRFKRDDSPVNYWFAMVSFAIGLGVMAACAVWFTLNGG